LPFAGERRHARLQDARLAVRLKVALVADCSDLARRLCAASADLLVIDAVPRDVAEAERRMHGLRLACEASGALLILAGPPVAGVTVDGYHLGSDDDVDAVRRHVGPDALLGRTVLTEAELRHDADQDVDYLAVAPALVAAAARSASHPWFVEVVQPERVTDHLEEGARRILVEADALGADDPSGATWQLRRALGRYP
jgi:thiamine monophosphate synthase